MAHYKLTIIIVIINIIIIIKIVLNKVDYIIWWLPTRARSSLKLQIFAQKPEVCTAGFSTMLTKANFDVNLSYLATQLLHTVENSCHVRALAKVSYLEKFCLWDSVAFAEIQEILDVFHLGWE